MQYSLHHYPPSPSSPLSHKSLQNYANNITLSSNNLNEVVRLTPEELARIDASLTNFFQTHPLTSEIGHKESKRQSEWQRNGENPENDSLSMSLEPLVPTTQRQTKQVQSDNNNHSTNFVQINPNEFDKLSVGGNNHALMRTSPQTYQHPQSDPFIVDNNNRNHQEVSDSMKAQIGESVRGLPPTPPVTSSVRKDLPFPGYNQQPQQYYQPQYTQFSQTQPAFAFSSPFSPDMKAFDDMKRLYEERIQLMEVGI